MITFWRLCHNELDYPPHRLNWLAAVTALLFQLSGHWVLGAVFNVVQLLSMPMVYLY